MKSQKTLKRELETKSKWEKHRKETLKKVGYDKLKAKHGKSLKPSFPDYSVENKYQLSNKIGNGIKKPSGASHKDAKSFPLYEAHKSNAMLMVSTDTKEHSGGKKT